MADVVRGEKRRGEKVYKNVKVTSSLGSVTQDESRKTLGEQKYIKNQPRH